MSVKSLAVVCVLAFSLRVSAAPKWRGAKVDFDLTSAELADIVRVIADTGRVNIVLVDVPPMKIAVKAKEPWDKVLDDIVKNAKLDYVRTGSLFLIGQPAWVAERRKQNKAKYKGVTIDLQIKDAAATAAVLLLARTAGTAFETKGDGPRKLSPLNLRRVPADQAFELVLLQSGATAVDKPAALAAPAAGCVAPTVKASELTLHGLATSGTKRYALLVDAKGAPYIVTASACLGLEKVKVAQVGDGYVDLDAAGAKSTLALYPVSMP